MTTRTLHTTSYWIDSTSMPRFPRLDHDLNVDVAIVGGGITGLTAAYLLKREGLSVAVIDRDRAGGVDTGHTSAHVTCVTDQDLTDLASTFGRDHAQATWDAGLAAIDTIDRIVRDNDIACEWRWVTGYKVSMPDGGDVPHLRDEAALAGDLGFDAWFRDAVPFFQRPGIEYAGQAKFHPRKYLAALAKLVDGGGSHIFDRTACDEVCDEPLSVKANGHRISAGYVVIATHTPLTGKTNLVSALLFQTKLYLYTSYVVAGAVPFVSASGSADHRRLPEALFWATNDPYDYLRIDRRRDYDFAILGGKDHKTGQVDDTTACFEAMEKKAQSVLPGFELRYRWSGQVVETNDGLPFIGESSDRQFIATGYAGNGMTFGTIAGVMARDAAVGRSNPWNGLFDVGRSKIKGGTWDYVKENADYPYYMMRDRFAGADGKSLREVRRGEGKILELDGQQVAVYRAPDGAVTKLSATCTHMGCTVGWNNAEQTWDCPCHGSRFRPTGQVLAGPAESPLEPITTR